MPHLPGRSRRYGRLLGCALAAAAACLALPAAAYADSTSLTTDAGGSPLVTALQLTPGHLIQRCVVVTTPTAYDSADLAMYATSTGGLADHLNVSVESGAGGGFADCTGFTGRLIYVGTLSGLVSSYDATHPERVGHYSTTVSAVTLRLSFTVQDDNAAQGQTTTAAFWWLPVASDPVPPLPVSPTPAAPSAAVTPTSAAPTSVRPVTSPRPAHDPPAPTSTPTSTPHSRRPDGNGGGPLPTTDTKPPTPAPAASSLAPPVGLPLTGGHGSSSAVAPGGGRSGDDGGSAAGNVITSIATGLANGVATAAHAVSSAAAPALQGAAYTSLLILPLVVVFLLVQRWIDRRDPKLALAPSYGDPFLGFVDRHRIHRQGDTT